MLKKITEPQALYQKQHGGSDDAAQVTPPRPKKKTSFKVIGGFIAVALFLVVGIGGVAVVQRQRQLANAPVAPNAPASRPAASEGTRNCQFCNGSCVDTASQACTTGANAPAGYSCIDNATNGRCESVPTAQNSFTSQVCAVVLGVSATTTVTPTASCTSKTAALVTPAGTIPLIAGQSVAPDDVIEYTVTLASSTGTARNVSIEDRLPTGVTFTEATTAGVTHSSGVVTYTAAQLSGSVAIKYRVKVNQLTASTDLVNTVRFTNNGSGSAAATSCTSTVKYVPVNKAQATCQEKLAFKDGADGQPTKIDGTGGSVEKGQAFWYRIVVKLTGPSNGAVVVEDTLPKGISFVSALSPASITGVKNANGTTTVTANLGTITTPATPEAPQVINVDFRVKLDSDVLPGNFINTATVKTGTQAAQACTHTVKLLPTATAACEFKHMYKSAGSTESSERIKEGSELKADDTFWYRVQLKTLEQTAGSVTITDVVPSTLEILETGEGVTKSGNTLTKTVTAFSQADKPFMEFKVKVKSSTKGTVTNKATTVTSGAGSDTCSSDFTVPTYSCNSSCNSNSDCTAVNSSYTCASTSDGKRCRLSDNTSSSSCQPAEEIPVGCNDKCVTNADCSNPSHICYNTGSESRCRLDTNVSSSSCSNPGSTATPRPTTQPTLPQELPQTGPEDWANWLKAGLVTLGVGAVLLLLL